jgi:predicted RNA-binding protein associated with RNAse of E/G family
MKILSVAVVVVSLGMLSACVEDTPTKPDTNTMRPMVGGYSHISVHAYAVENGGKFAAQQLGGELDKIIKAEQQLVAGHNYRMHILLKNKAEYEVVVYENSQGVQEMTSSKLLKPASAAAAQPSMLGGFSPVSSTDSQVQAAAHYASNSFNSELVKIIKAEQQIVAGTNYHLVIELANKAVYDVVVNVALGNNAMSLSSVKQLKGGNL